MMMMEEEVVVAVIGTGEMASWVRVFAMKARESEFKSLRPI